MVLVIKITVHKQASHQADRYYSDSEKISRTAGAGAAKNISLLLK